MTRVEFVLSIAMAMTLLSGSAHAEQKPLATSSQKTSVATMTESSWSASFLAQVLAHRIEKKSYHLTEVEVAYSFNSILSLSGWGAYSGPVYQSQTGQAAFVDPEFDLNLDLPLSGQLKQWTVLAGVGVLVPVSEESKRAGAIGALKMTGGFKWKGGGWRVQQTSTAYLYSYRERQQPNPAGDIEDETSDVTLLESNTHRREPDPRDFLATLHLLRIGRTFAEKITVGSKIKYDTSATGDGEFSDKISVSVKLGYKWLPNVETFLGGATAADFSGSKTPRLFDEESLSAFVGLYMSI